MPESSKFLWAAELTLQRYRQAMSASDIYARAKGDGLIPDTFHGRTPVQTMKSKLSTHILKYGESSTFVRTRPGVFSLREFTDASEIYTAARWLPPASQEVVTVVSSELLRGSASFQGLKTDVDRLFTQLFLSGKCVSMPRSAAEATEDYKQIITYVLVRRRGCLLAYRRGVYNQTADMLKGSDCIGFGGHVNAEDFTLMSTDDAGIAEAAARELFEELTLPGPDIERLMNGEGLRVVGIINDDSSAVGRRHVAVVLEYEVSDDPSWDQPTRGEESITKLRWVGKPEQTLNLVEFEYWSQLCLRSFAADLVRMQPSFKVVRRSVFKPPHLLCLVGEIGSGKTEAAHTLAREFDYAEINAGRVVAELIGLPPVTPETRAAFQAEANRFITSDSGPKRLAEAIAKRTSDMDTARVLVDGLRQPATLRELRFMRDPERVPVIYFMTAPDIAYSFYKIRESRQASVSEFFSLRDSPVEREVRFMLAEADAVLYNWVGWAEFTQALSGILQGT